MIPAPSVAPHEYILQDWLFEDKPDDDAIAVADTIRRWAIGENWLDLGCGPMVSVWPMFSETVKKVTGLDRFDGTLSFHKVICESKPEHLPDGIKRALLFYNRNFAGTHGFKIRNTTAIEIVQHIEIGDVTLIPNSWLSCFDTVIQIGCFGCLDSIDSLRIAIRGTVDCLRSGGTLISATWIPREGYLESSLWGGNKITHITEEKMIDEYQAANLAIKERRLAVLNQKNYSKRYILIFEKRS